MSKPFVQHGVRCCIGNVSQIPLWDAPWLQNGSILQRPNPCPQHLNSLVIKDLWLPHAKEWDVALIHNLFPAHTTTTILNTPLNDMIQVDRLVWTPIKDGIYSVKTAYNLAVTSLADCSHLRDEG